MNHLTRPTALKIAAVLSFLSNAYSLVFSLPFIILGADAANQATEGPPYSVILLAFVLGIIGIVAAYGTWKQMRWGVILTILVNLIGGLSAAPGIIFRPTPFLFASATIGVVIDIVIIVLCLWRDRQPAVA